MTSHELARKLLEGEDLPVVVWRDDGSDQSLEIKELPIEMYRFIGTDDTCSDEEVLGLGLSIDDVKPVLEFQIC